MTALRITATGMCCAVGYSTEAVSACIRAGMNHFRETEFTGPQGQFLIGAQLYDIDLWGPARMGWMLQRVLSECLSKDPRLIPSETCLLLIVPEPARSGAHQGWPQEIYRASNSQYAFHHSSRIMPLGKTGLIAALKLAQELLSRREVQRVLIAGVDSFLTPAAITHYMDRLLSDENPEGFIPGEGAGAAIVTLPDHHADSIVITGLGQASEEAHYLQEEQVNRGRGLSAAMRMAAKDSGIALADTHFHISTDNGEAFYARETAVAITRCLERKVRQYPHLMIHANLGETGAAAGPLILAYLAATLHRADNPGSRALMHMSADAGERAAAIVEYIAVNKKENPHGGYWRLY